MTTELTAIRQQAIIDTRALTERRAEIYRLRAEITHLRGLLHEADMRAAMLRSENTLLGRECDTAGEVLGAVGALLDAYEQGPTGDPDDDLAPVAS